jgi:hypothetical protein
MRIGEVRTKALRASTQEQQNLFKFLNIPAPKAAPARSV